MQSLGAFLLLPAAIYGFVRGGWAGALTGLVTVLAIGSGLAIFLAEPGTGVEESPRPLPQRFGGMVAAVATLGGAVHGGWRSGWLWGAAGFLLGLVVALGVGALSGRVRPDAM
jgi:hypothetical protein